ncbi:bifunctional diguanylate cyclase/phosphodiesterase [Vibrio sp. TH_r3]|uniref:putative bifunctional diguanylate cyclase/phosphodiesterase n=1 Tax=Vibrio sp. TH_r3 TaxID=3082084 RepID=UPI002954C746|nr:bifunctional diguanylate cyclase/phosphodiesterase [Vibrio sp. TH_r3]MDV7103529.1 bifunctional diguanylate cyclase/phosphodiesterase [Vibrio sp. TH_r3]
MTNINISEFNLPPDVICRLKNLVELLHDFGKANYSCIVQDIRSPSVISSSHNFPYQSPDKLTSLVQTITQNFHSKNGTTLHGTVSIKNHSNSEDDTIYYVAQILFWPDNSVFGAIIIGNHSQIPTIVDNEKLLLSCKQSIEAHLKTVYQHIRIESLTEQLRIRSDNKTKNIANLNYTLSKEINKRKAAEQQVSYHKSHDIGTGFLNQQALIERTNEMLSVAQSNQQKLAVVHVNFSNGRKIQERHGDSILDELLTAFRDRIGQIDCINSVTARIGIANVILVIRSKHLQPFIEHFCHRCIEICHSDFLVEQEHVHLHTFIGVSTNLDSTDAEDLVYFANEAAFACKDTGRQYSYYSETDTEQRMHTNEIESYLLEAVRNEDIELYYQPKVNLNTGAWVGAEALIRWNHPILGTISNDNLIQLAEQNGLIFEVGNFALRNAIENVSEWALADDFKIAVNVSAMQLQNIDFVSYVENLLQTYDFPASKLELELTESCLISNEYLARKILNKLSHLGITLSLDDFGTGYASFSYLKNYPFNSLKIDKSFVQNLTQNSSDQEIVHSIVQIAKKLELDVTIEGVEDIDQERFLLNEGCDFAQGYLYGKPMTDSDFIQNIRK